MPTDPLFYLAVIPAVLIMGIAKGGMGGGLGVVSVPLMSLVMPPTQAAAILLPILCVMDLFALWGFRGLYDRNNLKTLLPAALFGILVGTVSFRYLEEAHIKLIVGFIAVVFTLNWLIKRLNGRTQPAKPARAWLGRLFGSVAGFTSFSVHAGGPPLDMYLLPQQLHKSVFVGTTVVFFTVVNYVKLIPYAWLGLFDTRNLTTSLGLIVLAPLGIWMGIYMHRRISEGWFYALCYGLLLVSGVKLSVDGMTALMS